MNKNEVLSNITSMEFDLRWALSKLMMAKEDAKNDQSGGVSNEMNEVMMSLGFAINKGQEIKKLLK